MIPHHTHPIPIHSDSSSPQGDTERRDDLSATSRKGSRSALP